MLIIRRDFISSRKYLDWTFRFLEDKVDESLYIFSVSDWFSETLSYKLSSPTRLSD